MRQKDIINHIAARLGVTPSVVKAIQAGLLHNIVVELSKGETVTISGFGRFYTIPRHARQCPHPCTGKMMFVKATKTIKFEAGRPFKELVRGTQKDH